MASSPPVCPLCKGSRLLIVFAPDFDNLHALDKMTGSVGFWREVCYQCDGKGTLSPHCDLGEYPPPPKDDES